MSRLMKIYRYTKGDMQMPVIRYVLKRIWKSLNKTISMTESTTALSVEKSKKLKLRLSAHLKHMKFG